MGIREGANSFVTAIENEVIQTRTDLFTAIDELGARMNAGFDRQQGQINELRGEVSELKGEVSELRGEFREFKGQVVGFQAEVVGLLGGIQQKLAAM